MNVNHKAALRCQLSYGSLDNEDALCIYYRTHLLLPFEQTLLHTFCSVIWYCKFL